MCGIAGIARLNRGKRDQLERGLQVMAYLIRHRGPDGHGQWMHPHYGLGFAHRRLSIIDIDHGSQPMEDSHGRAITYNGEIYNYKELRKELSADYAFRTQSDTEVILAAYHRWGENCVERLRGMFAFAIWDETEQKLFCARDRFGIKPFYYTQVGDTLYFASEIKALCPYLPSIETDLHALHDYIAFQLTLENRTLFKGVKELRPGHTLIFEGETLREKLYWEVFYDLDFDHTPQYFQRRLRELIEESVHLHTRSDVPIGAYVSGGIDSGVVASVAKSLVGKGDFLGFTGKFGHGPDYDESSYARALADAEGFQLLEVDISSEDFLRDISKVIYHLDHPIAGPGAFPQFQVSRLAAQHRKVVLGGQGGDEIFGGYTRYLIAYFEQCIKAAIDGTMDSGNFVVTYQSIIPNLRSLKNYKPLLKQFWSQGLFEDIDKRYYQLINRAGSMDKEIHWEMLGDYHPFETFRSIFYGDNVGKASYFDLMTHFDFKTLLKGLLHVEDRMSMAHGLESRVPLVDHEVVEFAATMPANIKFKDGTLKMVLTQAMQDYLPRAILDRKDKMGFPVPLNEWIQSDLREFTEDLFRSQAMHSRPYFNAEEIVSQLGKESKFGRKTWGLMSLELWHQQFHDRESEFKQMLTENAAVEQEAILPAAR